jgi:hypothetical protein
MPDLNLPIICTLSETDLRERRRNVLDYVRTLARGVRPLPDGFAYEFAFDPETLAALARVVALEHECCRFLTFKLIVGAGDGPMNLEVTGPPGAKALIEEFLGQ